MSSRPLPEVRNLFSPPPRPPILPVVTAQMLLDTYEVALLVSKIELPTAGHLGPMRHQRFQHRFASAPPKSLHIPPSRYTPYTVPDRTVRYRPVSSMAADDTSPPSRSSSSVPEEANLDNNVMEAPSMAVDEPGERSFSDKNDHENGKISKPPGEVGRPNSGGYNLEVALDWSAADYKNLLAFVHKEVDKRCNTKLSYKSQYSGTLEAICTETVKSFSKLNNYDKYWPVNDIIMMRLKNTSAKWRRNEQEGDNDTSRKKKNSKN